MGTTIRDFVEKQSTWNLAHRLLNSDDIKVVEGATGVQFWLEKKTAENSAGISTQDTYLCKITGGTTAAGYTVDIYGNGYGSAVTATGTCEAIPLALGSNLPVGYPLVVAAVNTTITGGT